MRYEGRVRARTLITDLLSSAHVKGLLMRALALCTVFAVLGAPAVATAQLQAMGSLPDFSADYVVTSDGESYDMTMMSSGSKMRIEMDMGDAGGINIIDRDTMQSISLIDAGGMKMAMKVDANSVLAQMPSDMTETDTGSLPPKTGTKTIAGHVCNTYADQGSELCITSDGIMLESITPDGGMVATRMDRGAQPDSAFEVPPGYQVMDMGAMMGGMNIPGLGD